MSAPATILPIATAAQTRAAMWRLLARRPGLLAATIAVLLLAASCGLAAPAILGYMVNTVVGGGEPARLLWAAVALLAAGVAGAGLGVLGQVALARICEGALAGLREDVFAAAANQPLARIEAAGIGDVVARVSGDVEAVSEAISGVLPAFSTAAFTIAVTVVGLGIMDWRFAVAALIAAPLQVFSLRWFLRRTAPVYREVRLSEARRAEQIIETVHGARTVLALGHGTRHSRLVANASEETIGHSIQGINLLTRFFNRLNLAELIGLAAVLSVGFWLVGDGAVTLGAATAAALYFYRLFDPIGTVLGQFDELQKAGAGLSRMFGLTQLGGPPAAPAPVGSAPQQNRSVILTDLSFAYAGNAPVVKSVNLTVNDGERVALVGASGAGKTSLAKLVMGLHLPSAGSVRVAGHDVAATPPDQLHRHVALVSQDVHVFSGTLAEDLRLASPDAGEDRLAAVLQSVGAGWVAGLEAGMETVVGSGGHELTAEQAQQLALARLILRDPPIVILDEATAEAGTGSARMLDHAAEAALSGRTAIVIAHRLSQAVTADRVVVMDSGRIVETGTHAELVAAGGLYGRLWRAWSRDAD
ncbi:MAG: msbA1 [Pseudarthrobacter sp.]|nr:msbA1 [Pseudarthrobacter sp.]